MSVKAWIGKDDDRELVLRMRAPDRITGEAWVNEIVDSLPDEAPGYVWRETHMARGRTSRGKHQGQRVSVTVVLFCRDTRERMFTPNEGERLFSAVLGVPEGARLS